MIVVVEGPSGAGKTTWCRRHGGAHALLEDLPDHSTVPQDSDEQARFGSTAMSPGGNEFSNASGVTDLWSWTSIRSSSITCGHSGSRGRCRSGNWDLQREASRAAFSAGEYALADLYLVSDIDEATLRARRDADTTRTRRGFERHVLLRESLLRWYRAIDALEPGRVRFELPETGLTPELLALGPRRVRSGAELFERLLTELR